MTEDRKPLDMTQQADLLEEITSRCLLMDGSVASETTKLLRKQDVLDLIHLTLRLRRMAPHSKAIEKMVMGK